jgi:pimeloyl-ACP methyl ester carboxylesterase
MRNLFRYTKTMIQSSGQLDEGAPPQFRDQYVEIDGAALRYRDDGTGPAVVLIHGWTLDLEMWDPQAAPLGEAYRVIRLDRRGFGLSSGDPSLARDVSDLRALCRHLQLERVALLGMSQGARVALQLASESPAMVSCLVLDGPGVGPASGPLDVPHEHYRRVAQTHGLAAFRREWAQHPLTKLRTESMQARDLLARMIARYPGKDLTHPLPSPPLVTTLDMIRSIVPPVLLIGGALDLDSRKGSAHEFMLQLPSAERAEISHAGHLCNLDNPRAYNSALQNFLDRHAASRSAH